MVQFPDVKLTTKQSQFSDFRKFELHTHPLRPKSQFLSSWNQNMKNREGMLLLCRNIFLKKTLITQRCNLYHVRRMTK